MSSFLTSNFLVIKLVFIIIKSCSILGIYLILDNRNHTKHTTTEYISIFIFGELYVLYDVYTTLKSKKGNYRTLVIILTFLLLLNSILGFTEISVRNFEQNDKTTITTETKYYDRQGIEYESLDDVIYYTTDGAEFKYDSKNSSYICIVNANNRYQNKYDDIFSYVDKNGRIVFIEKLLDYDKSQGDYGFYYEENDEYYGNVNAIRWNSDGTVYWDY